jgi:hypothetical protein
MTSNFNYKYICKSTNILYGLPIKYEGDLGYPEMKTIGSIQLIDIKYEQQLTLLKITGSSSCLYCLIVA